MFYRIYFNYKFINIKVNILIFIKNLINSFFFFFCLLLKFGRFDLILRYQCITFGTCVIGLLPQEARTIRYISYSLMTWNDGRHINEETFNNPIPHELPFVIKPIYNQYIIIQYTLCFLYY